MKKPRCSAGQASNAACDLSQEFRATRHLGMVHASRVISARADYLLVNRLDRHGVMRGDDIELIQEITCSRDVLVMACDGTRAVAHSAVAIKPGAPARGTRILSVDGRYRTCFISCADAEMLGHLRR